LAFFERIQKAEGCDRAVAFDILCHIFEWGFTSHAKRDVRGRVQAIAVATELAMKDCLGDSLMAVRLREIRRAVLEIPVLLGDGEDGSRVGKVIVLPPR
jgi:hypothetical protein